MIHKLDTIANVFMMMIQRKEICFLSEKKDANVVFDTMGKMDFTVILLIDEGNNMVGGR